MGKALERAGIKAVYNFPVRCKYGYVLDFAIPDLKICIECDGEMWHPIGNAHDRKRDGFLKSIGWKILRFRGKQIKGDIGTCLIKLREVIKNEKN